MAALDSYEDLEINIKSQNTSLKAQPGHTWSTEFSKLSESNSTTKNVKTRHNAKPLIFNFRKIKITSF